MAIRISILGLISALVLIGGCATPGGGFLNTNVPGDAGSAPTQYEQTIRAYLRTALKDPNSMIDFSVSEPILTSCAVGIYGPFHGWRVAVSYNAKNSYGGYVGLNTYYYWFHNERLQGIGANPGYCPEAAGWRIDRNAGLQSNAVAVGGACREHRQCIGEGSYCDSGRCVISNSLHSDPPKPAM